MAVKLKWGKQTFMLDVDPEEGFEVLKAQVFALTNVPVERQKLLVKGKVLKEGTDLSIILKAKKLMLMGTAEALIQGPTKKIEFIEDMPESKRVQLQDRVSAGLQNMGNTCYLNSGLQCLRYVGELKEELTKSWQTQSDPLTSYLGSVYAKLDTSPSTVVPISFVDAFRKSYPQFSEQNERGAYKQQDADESMVEILSHLSRNMTKTLPLKSRMGESKTNLIQQLFGGEMEYTLTNKEVPSESSTGRESFTKLKCFIDIKTNFLFQGLENYMNDEIEKRSPSLGRNVLYTKQSKISKLPKYLIVQFVRFFWKKEAQKKAKIMRRVQFNEKLDILNYCSNQLKSSLQHVRVKLKEEEDAKLGLIPLGKTEDESNPKKQKVEEKTEPKEEEEPQVPPQPTDSSGNYELTAVVTHQGRAADSGHYIGWVRTKPGSGDWLQFNDDVVTEHTTADILKLCGGGDWHMAYLCIYRRIDDVAGRDFEA